MTLNADAERREEADIATFITYGESGPVLKNVPIFRAGDYSHKGKGIWNTSDLAEVAKNFQTLKNANELIPPIKSSHDPDNRGLPVLGWIERVVAKGKDLLADFRLISDQVVDLIKKGGFRFRSAELHSSDRPYLRPDGSRLSNVLRGVAFVPVPEVKGMPDIRFEFASFEEAGDEAVSVNFEEDSPMPKWRHTKTGQVTTEDMSGKADWEKFTEDDPKAKKDGEAEGQGDQADDGAAGQAKEGDAEADAGQGETEAGEGEAGAEDGQSDAEGAEEGEDGDAEAGDGEAETEDNADGQAGEGETENHADKDKEKDAAACQDMAKIACPECGKQIEIEAAGGPCPECKANLTAAAVKKALEAMKAADKGKATKAQEGNGKDKDAEKYGKPKVPFASEDGTLNFEAARAAVADLDVETLRDNYARTLVANHEAKNDIAEAWADRMVAEGRMVPAQRDRGARLRGAACDVGSLPFGDEQETFAEAFRKYVEAGGKVIDYGETATQDGPDAGARKASASHTMSDDEVKAEVERIKKGE